MTAKASGEEFIDALVTFVSGQGMGPSGGSFQMLKTHKLHFLLKHTLSKWSLNLKERLDCRRFADVPRIREKICFVSVRQGCTVYGNTNVNGGGTLDQYFLLAVGNDRFYVTRDY